MENENLNLPKENKTKTLLATITIVVLFLGLLFVTFSYFTSPRRKIIDSITKFYTSAKEKMNGTKGNNILSNPLVGINGEVKINLKSNEESLKEFKNFYISYDYKEDKDKKRSSFNIDSSINSSKFLEIVGLTKNDKMYINFKNLIDKFYHMNYEFISLLKANNPSDTIYITDILKDSIISNITNDYFEKGSAEIKVNGKNVKTIKHTLNINNKLVNKIGLDTLEKIKKDGKALNIIGKSYGIKNDEVVSKINEMIKDIKEDDTTYNYKYNIYVKNFVQTVKQELVIEDVIVSFYEYGNTKEISISVSSFEMIDIKIDTNKKTIDGNISTIKISGKYNENSTNINLSGMGQTVDLEIKTEENISDEEYKNNIEAKIDVKNGDIEYFTLGINIKSTLSKIEKIDNADVTKSIDIENIPESDMEKIMTKLMELPIFNVLANTSTDTAGLQNNM